MAEPNSPWLDVLDRIDQAILHFLTRTPELPAPAAKKAQAAPLAQIDERLARWQARLVQAEQEACEAEESLAAEQDALEQCRAGLARIREVLAGWVSRAGGAPAEAPAPASVAGSPSNPPAT